MKNFSTIFDDGFVSISVNKKQNYGPVGLSALGGPINLDANGNCKRACIPKTCDCDDPSGDCPGTECWGDQGRCECHDEGDSTASYAVNDNRCQNGTFCWKGCPTGECCHPPPPTGGGQTCLKDWLENWNHLYTKTDPDIEDPGWKAGEYCAPPANAQSLLGTLDAPPCGCAKGKCTFRYSALGAIYCLENVNYPRLRSPEGSLKPWASCIH